MSESPQGFDDAPDVSVTLLMTQNRDDGLHYTVVSRVCSFLLVCRSPVPYSQAAMEGTIAVFKPVIGHFVKDGTF
jgi:hypothetical protein